MKVEVFSENVSKYEAWYDQYQAVYLSEIEALKEHFNRLPQNITGIEIGVGTGKFAVPLGIKEGIEPSREMAELASQRGIEIMKGKAEALPYKDLHFDFILMVTICHFDNIERAIEEAHRVLKHGGFLIIGLLNKDGAIAQSYLAKRKWSVFYKHAQFYTVDYVTDLMKKFKFKEFYYTQTLFGELDDIKSLQQPKPGHGEGSFTVISAYKK